jgi:hypothetical protein
MANIGKLTKNGTTIYPQTIGDAVALDGETLSEAISAMAKVWTGTSTEYYALSEYDDNTVYYIVE